MEPRTDLGHNWCEVIIVEHKVVTQVVVSTLAICVNFLIHTNALEMRFCTNKCIQNMLPSNKYLWKCHTPKYTSLEWAIFANDFECIINFHLENYKQYLRSCIKIVKLFPSSKIHCLQMYTGFPVTCDTNKNLARNQQGSAIAVTARVTTRPLIAVDRRCRSANRNPEYNFCRPKFYFNNRLVNTWNYVPSYIHSK